ncbi:MRN complex-interacting protein isoform X2 [Perca fluviatilis]|uniref:MRN complex-interacting protein isoform X2 n=1 Tax=Perca fluviatilis TaxID=8168 RepID=UPI001962B9AA|nr:MRN complex-interacting protein isoform X2 [Perca fluviatilis]
MVQEFHVVRCFSCQSFQVHQVKKVNRWSCKLCGEKQSLKKEFGRGSGADCRRHVQKLNAMRGAVMEKLEHHTWSLWKQEVEEEEEEEEHEQESPGSRWSKYLPPPEEAEPEDEENVLMDRQHLHGNNPADRQHLHSNNPADRKRKRRERQTDGGRSSYTPEQLNWSGTTSAKTTSSPSTSLNQHSPSLKQPCPSLNRHSLNQPSLNQHSPSLNRPSLNQHSPSLNQHSPSLNQPSLNQHSPSLNRPSLNQHSPSLNRPSLNQHSLNQHSPSLKQPSLNQHSPSLNQPSLNQHSPSLNRPSLNRPSLNRPSLNMPSPPSMSSGPACRWSCFLSSSESQTEGAEPLVSGRSQTVGGAASLPCNDVITQARPRPLLPVSSMFDSGEDFSFDDFEIN